MRYFLFLIFIFCAPMGYTQISKIFTQLPDYTVASQGVVHTIKVEVTNNNDKCMILYLHNDEEITGIDLSDSDCTNPIQFIEEYGSMLNIESESWLPTLFGVWLKKMEPNSTFTLYFQSKLNIEPNRLLDLIRVSNNNYCNRTRAMNDLGWKADEIIIYLPLSAVNDK